MTMKELVHRVVVARMAVAGNREALESSRRAWELANAEAFETLRANTEFLQEAEAALKAAALEVFSETQTKKPAPGVGIREMTRLVYEPSEAFTWATEHGLAVQPAQLDVKAFEKIAKAMPLPFVTTRTDYVVTIASDLADAAEAG